MAEITETINTQIVHVPFHGQTVDAIDDGPRGEYLVVFKPLCENLGLDPRGQQQRLERQPWAVACMMHATGADGKTYQMLCIDRQTMVMWLATIDVNRLKSDEARRVVAEYQKECAKALDSYFSNGFAVNSDDFETVCKALLIAKDKLDERDATVKSLETLNGVQDKYIDELEPKALIADAVFLPSVTSYTVTEATRYIAGIVPGIKRDDVFAMLRKHGMMCKAGTAPTRVGIDTGRLIAVADEYTDENGERRAGKQRGKLTPKGVAFCIERLAAGEVA